MKPNQSDPYKFPEIPLTACPQCKAGFMAIKSVSPRLRRRDGVDVEFACPRCEAVVAATVSPAQPDARRSASTSEPEQQSAG